MSFDLLPHHLPSCRVHGQFDDAGVLLPVRTNNNVQTFKFVMCVLATLWELRTHLFAPDGALCTASTILYSLPHLPGSSSWASVNADAVAFSLQQIDIINHGNVRGSFSIDLSPRPAQGKGVEGRIRTKTLNGMVP